VSDGRTLFDADGTGFSGTVEVLRVVYDAAARTGADDNYAVLQVLDIGRDERFTLVGPVAHLTAGSQADVSGDWETNQKYGRQVKARGAVVRDPTDRDGQIAYLASLRNIGPARAERLVEAHGDEVLAAIGADPEAAFAALPGVSEAQAVDAVESWHDSRAIRDLHVQLAPHGLAHLGAAIHTHFEDRAMRVLREDPYRLTEAAGVGFARADKIALARDVAPDSERRLQAAAAYVLGEAEQRGNVYLPVEELTRATEELLGLPVAPEVLDTAPGLVLEGDRAYREPTHAAELAVAATLAARAAAPPELGHEPPELPPENLIGEVKLTDEQWAAVRGAFAARVSVLTGGPGVGKTACTKAIVDEAGRAGVSVALCAPTGRAARRMEEATEQEAETIHRMLEWIPGQEPGFRPSRPLPVELVVVDESSMLNLRLVEVLLGGLAETTHVVFVGDVDQLPPIGAGKPFENLIESEVVPVVRLTQIFRRAAESMITTAAHEINQGQAPHLEPEEEQHQDFFFIDRAEPREALETVVRVVAERASKRFDVDPVRDVQVLAPKYKGPIGIDELNKRLQARLNPDGAVALGGRFRLGDRLIQGRNAPDLGLMNGSVVFLREDDPAERQILVETDDGDECVISYPEAQDLSLAYAISVHKAQGCEVPVVVGVCHSSHGHMLTRPLLYTAITRARRGCVLVGNRSMLSRAAGRDDGGSRYSALAERLRAA
jgi:exodeoxyribonuclease V alpha subunit